ncbi:MAG: hypothetical protein KAH54_06045 [Candidatus Sabulitectum sp.]|nr:hypothetical protein [Candidatus Sabulitectum sp.]
MRNRTKLFCSDLLVPAGLVLVLLGFSMDALAVDHHREGWFIGLGYGYSPGAIKISTGQEFEFNEGVTPQLRFGHSFGEHFTAGVDYNGWMFEEGELSDKYRYSMQSINAAFTWYPGSADSNWGGFYTTASVGRAWCRGVWVSIEEQQQGESEYLSETGLGLAFQLGYEFRITANTAAGLNAGFNHLEIGKLLFDQVKFAPINITLNWYWD